MSEATKVEDMILTKGLTAPRVTPEQIEALVDRVRYRYAVQGTSTFCHVFLDDKFYLVTGHSACVSPENFDEGIGRTVAFNNAAAAMRNKLWELEGYALYKEMSNV